MNNEYATMSIAEVEDLIADLQNVQKRNPPTSRAWEEAHAALEPLFAEMAERTAR